MTAVEPALRLTAPSRGRLLRAPLQSLAVLGAATVAVHLRDPHVSGSWGYCPSRLLFGIDCPGCGGLRAVHDVTHLDLGAAVSSCSVRLAVSSGNAGPPNRGFAPSNGHGPKVLSLRCPCLVVEDPGRRDPRGMSSSRLVVC